MDNNNNIHLQEQIARPRGLVRQTQQLQQHGPLVLPELRPPALSGRPVLQRQELPVQESQKAVAQLRAEVQALREALQESLDQLSGEVHQVREHQKIQDSQLQKSLRLEPEERTEILQHLQLIQSQRAQPLDSQHPQPTQPQNGQPSSSQLQQGQLSDSQRLHSIHSQRPRPIQSQHGQLSQRPEHSQYKHRPQPLVDLQGAQESFRRGHKLYYNHFGQENLYGAHSAHLNTKGSFQSTRFN